jgi:hypothetical protein
MGRNGKKSDLDNAQDAESTELVRHSVGLPPDLDAKVREAADRSHTSVQTVLRQYIRAGAMVDEADEVIIKKDGKEYRPIIVKG